MPAAVWVAKQPDRVGDETMHSNRQLRVLYRVELVRCVTCCVRVCMWLVGTDCDFAASGIGTVMYHGSGDICRI